MVGVVGLVLVGRPPTVAVVVGTGVEVETDDAAPRQAVVATSKPVAVAGQDAASPEEDGVGGVLGAIGRPKVPEGGVAASVVCLDATAGRVVAVRHAPVALLEGLLGLGVPEMAVAAPAQAANEVRRLEAQVRVEAVLVAVPRVVADVDATGVRAGAVFLVVHTVQDTTSVVRPAEGRQG